MKLLLLCIIFISISPAFNFEVENPSYVNKSEIIHSNILTKADLLPLAKMNITQLELRWLGITEIEDGAFDVFDSLEKLDISYNPLTQLTNKVLTSKLGETLKYLEVGENNITADDGLPLDLFEFMTNLKYFSIYGKNDRTSKSFIRKGLFTKSLNKLEELTLWVCNITVLDDNIFANLTNLKDLDLSGNRLTSIPKAIVALPNLIALHASSSEFTTLKYDNDLFHPTLQEITLDSSNIETIEDCAFCNFPSLKRLNFWESSKLRSFHENAFGSLTNKNGPLRIEEFKVDLCNLTTLPEKLLNWNEVKEISLLGNKWNCDCSMAWLIDDIKSKTNTTKYFTSNIIYGTSVKCFNPPEFHGSFMKDISKTFCNATQNLEMAQQEIFISTLSMTLTAAFFAICSTIIGFIIVRKVWKKYFYKQIKNQLKNLNEKEKLHESQENGEEKEFCKV